MGQYKNFLDQYSKNIGKLFKKISVTQLEKIVEIFAIKIKSNKKIFVCGNGGSLAIANHLLCDFTKTLRLKTNFKPKVISLVSNPELISAISNDISFNEALIFQAETHVQNEDMVLLISSSGNSENMIKLLKFLNKKNILTVSITGFKGGYLKKHSKFNIHFPVNQYELVEDMSHILMHMLTILLIKKLNVNN